MTFKDRTGEINKNSNGSTMIIEKYNGNRDVVIRFIEYNYSTHVRYAEFKNGSAKSPYDKTVFGIGCFGEGNYRAKINGKNTKEYAVWKSMMSRCYNSKENLPAYKDVIVCDEWLNFQHFASWYEQNYYEIEGQKMHLDKDILVKGNKIYSPETCIFVPQKINNLFIKRGNHRGNYPIGIVQVSNGYDARMSIDNERFYIGFYKTPEAAFHAYKEFKENHIKKIANEYKDKIPKKLYDSMISYQVEITD